MSTTFSGASYLDCHAFVKNPRPFYENGLFLYIIVDCSFPTEESNVHTDYAVASLVIRTYASSYSFVPGFFEIHAKVVLLFFLAWFLMVLQIVLFIPGIHEPSPMFKNDAFAFMGDILSVCTVAQHFNLNVTWLYSFTDWISEETFKNCSAKCLAVSRHSAQSQNVTSTQKPSQ